MAENPSSLCDRGSQCRATLPSTVRSVLAQTGKTSRSSSSTTARPTDGRCAARSPWSIDISARPTRAAVARNAGVEHAASTSACSTATTSGSRLISKPWRPRQTGRRSRYGRLGWTMSRACRNTTMHAQHRQAAAGEVLLLAMLEGTSSSPLPRSAVGVLEDVEFGCSRARGLRAMAPSRRTIRRTGESNFAGSPLPPRGARDQPRDAVAASRSSSMCRDYDLNAAHRSVLSDG